MLRWKGRDAVDSNSNHDTVQSNLELLRQRAGLTSAELARRAGVDQSIIEALEAGDQAADDAALTRLAEILGVDKARLAGHVSAPLANWPGKLPDPDS
jgi:transcriptional regulator with XRE-family HTH domain